MKRIFFFILLACSVFASVHATTKEERIGWRHEVRLGWGDQLFESLIWHNPTNIVSAMPESFTRTYAENYHHNQHLWAEYHYHPNYWFSVGLTIDISEVNWTDVTRNGKGAVIGTDPGHYFANIVVMPTIRFTYLHHPYVNLYSGLGIGAGFNTGTEVNPKGQHTDVGYAVDLRVIGLSVTYKRFAFNIDAGGLYSVKDMNTIFMVSSKIISASIGVSF